MSFFSSLAKTVGGVVGGAVGTLILPGAGTALGAALGGAAAGAGYDAAAAAHEGGGGGGAAPPSLAPAAVYHGIYQAAGTQAARDHGGVSSGSRSLVARPDPVAAQKKARAILFAAKMKKYREDKAKGLVAQGQAPPKPPMSTGAKVAFAAGGGTLLVGGGTALFLALRK